MSNYEAVAVKRIIEVVLSKIGLKCNKYAVLSVYFCGTNASVSFPAQLSICRDKRQVLMSWRVRKFLHLLATLFY